MQEKVKAEKQPVKTEYIITESFTGKKQLKDILVDLLCSAYGSGKTSKPELK